MKLPSRLKTMNDIGMYPICPSMMTLRDTYGNENFGEGTMRPKGRHWMTNATIFRRPVKLFIRKGSYYEATRRLPTELGPIRYPFGPKPGPLRIDSGGRDVLLQRQLACLASNTVSQTITQNTPTPGLVDYQITMGFTIFPEVVRPGVADPETGQPINDKRPPFDKSIGAQFYMPQVASIGAYYIEDTATRQISSFRDITTIVGDTQCHPPGRYQEIGRCEVDFIDQFKPGGDNSELAYDFPLYRDVWTEDGTAPEECGGPIPPNPPNPLSWFSNSCLIRICYMAWDYPDNIAPDVPEETDE